MANIEAPDDGATILSGNRKVLAARLSDAKFFWENDLATVERGGMIGMAAPLANVTFHAKLGTHRRERVERIAALAREIAPAVGAKPPPPECRKGEAGASSRARSRILSPRCGGDYAPSLLRRGRRGVPRLPAPAGPFGAGGPVPCPGRWARVGARGRLAGGARAGRSTRSPRGRRTPMRSGGRRWG